MSHDPTSDTDEQPTLPPDRPATPSAQVRAHSQEPYDIDELATLPPNPAPHQAVPSPPTSSSDSARAVPEPAEPPIPLAKNEAAPFPLELDLLDPTTVASFHWPPACPRCGCRLLGEARCSCGERLRPTVMACVQSRSYPLVTFDIQPCAALPDIPLSARVFKAGRPIWESSIAPATSPAMPVSERLLIELQWGDRRLVGELEAAQDGSQIVIHSQVDFQGINSGGGMVIGDHQHALNISLPQEQQPTNIEVLLSEPGEKWTRWDRARGSSHTAMTLEITTSTGQRKFFLAGGPRVSLGRDPRKCELALSRWTNDDRLLQQVSGKHASLIADVRSIRWCDESRNGTDLVLEDRVLRIERGRTIAMGQQAARLRLGGTCDLLARTHRLPTNIDLPAYLRFASRQITRETKHHGVSTSPLSLVLQSNQYSERHDCLVYLPLGTMVGSDDSCGVRCDPFPPLLAAVWYMAGQFWLEPWGSGLLRMEGRPLEVDELIRLAPGVVLETNGDQLTCLGAE